MSDAPEYQNHQVRWAVIVTMGRVVVEAETTDAARDKVERKGYIRARSQSRQQQPGGVVLNLHRSKKLSDKPPHERTTNGAMRNLFPNKVVEKTREVVQEKNEPEILEEDEAKAHDKGSVSENNRRVT